MGDNKKGKTFSDLVETGNHEEKSDLSHSSFGDIFKTSEENNDVSDDTLKNEKKDIFSESSDDVTLDKKNNIFDESSNNDKEVNFSSLMSSDVKSDDIGKNNEESLDEQQNSKSQKAVKDQSKEENAEVNFGSIVFRDESSEKKDDDEEQEENKEEDIKEDNTEVNFGSIMFGDDSSEKKDKDKEQEENKEEDIKEDNTEVNFGSIMFGDDSSEEKDKDKEQEENKEENIKEDNTEVNLSGVMFGNNNDENIQDVSSLTEMNAEQVSILNDDLSKKDKEEEKVELDSPFFSDIEDKSSEDNPLFLNTLNLIENENGDKAVSAIDPTKSKHFNVKIVKKKEPLFKIILGILSYALFIWLLLVGIALLIYVLDVKIRASKGDYSAPTYNAYVVLTGSMLPEIQVYDVVVTKKVEASDLKVGDIITFASADTRFLNTTITHRILKKNYDAESKGYSFQTKGDNNNVADSALVPQSNIYGKVILKIPKLGYLQEFLATDGGWIIVILIPCLVVVSYDIVKLVKGLKRKKYKNIKVQK